ncbi:hypothetical protein [Alteribacillus sp. YIM 98480]|uniref:hypothetical protein n=1 Tax=Alteribacillus sp. YIM 98480 TaxID=2606599 RepID=UPI00131D7687|nr:hypothetical protein [Alteribacillus sp. YIM 98480]
MSSASAYSLEIPSVRQWKAKLSFPYAVPLGLVAREQGACAFLTISAIHFLPRFCFFCGVFNFF